MSPVSEPRNSAVISCLHLKAELPTLAAPAQPERAGLVKGQQASRRQTPQPILERQIWRLAQHILRADTAILVVEG